MLCIFGPDVYMVCDQEKRSQKPAQIKVLFQEEDNVSERDRDIESI